MSPGEVRQILDANMPEKKVGKVSKTTFDRLKKVLSNAKSGNTKRTPNAG